MKGAGPYIHEYGAAVEMLDAALEELYELRGERDHWKDEPRLGRSRHYQELSVLIAKIQNFLGKQKQETP